VRIIFTLGLTASSLDAVGDLLKESIKVKKCADEEIQTRLDKTWAQRDSTKKTFICTIMMIKKKRLLTAR
jgi:hypothetical protein